MGQRMHASTRATLTLSTLTDAECRPPAVWVKRHSGSGAARRPASLPAGRGRHCNLRAPITTCAQTGAAAPPWEQGQIGQILLTKPKHSREERHGRKNC